MDQRLVSWARAVKARQARLGRRHPVLWLFTDSARLPDPLPAIDRLPRGLSGVVFRHDDAPDRLALAKRVAALCRRRGLALSVAGDPRVAFRLHAFAHVRARRRMFRFRSVPSLTGSAHTVAELRQLARDRVPLVFLAPVFRTVSHQGAAGLGPLCWARLARQCPHGCTMLALGGIDGRSAKRLPRFCGGAGAIGALV
jgi:thiamine-phosphate pyrophosphorylase